MHREIFTNNLNHLIRMKLTVSTLLAAALVAASVPALLAADECESVFTQVQKAVAEKPENVLAIVQENVAASEKCACEIVKAAISASKADKEMVGEIVFAAVTTAPRQATTIAECAVAVAPEASANIKAALQRSMGDEKNPVGDSGKNPKAPKEPVPPPPSEPDTADFGVSPLAIGGVYLIYPGIAGATTTVTEETVVTVVRRETRTRTVVVQVPVTPINGAQTPGP
jgi:hypothetical protein